MKKIITNQRSELSKPGHQGYGCPPNLPVVATIAGIAAAGIAEGNARKEPEEKTDRNAREKEEGEKKEPIVFETPSVWGSIVEKNNEGLRETPGFPQKNERDFGFTDTKDEPSCLSQITTPSARTSDGTGDRGLFLEKVSPGGVTEEVGLRTPLTNKGKNGICTPLDLSNVAVPSETVDTDRFGAPKNRWLDNISTRASNPLENEHFTDTEQGPSPTELIPACEVVPGTFANSILELPRSPQSVKGEAQATPKPLPAPFHTPGQSQVSAPSLAKAEPQSPLFLWEDKKIKATTQPAPASNSPDDDAKNASGVWQTVGDRRSVKTIKISTIVGTRYLQSSSVRDQERENPVTTKPAPKPFPAGSSGQIRWTSIPSNIYAIVIAALDIYPSPQSPIIEGEAVVGESQDESSEWEEEVVGDTQEDSSEWEEKDGYEDRRCRSTSPIVEDFYLAEWTRRKRRGRLPFVLNTTHCDNADNCTAAGEGKKKKKRRRSKRLTKKWEEEELSC